MSRREMLLWSFKRTFEQNTSEFEKTSVGRHVVFDKNDNVKKWYVSYLLLHDFSIISAPSSPSS